MTKQELIERICIVAAHKNGRMESIITKREAEVWMDVVCETVAKAVSVGEEVTLPGIGKLSVKDKPASTCRHPATGMKMAIPAKTVPHFSAAKALKDAVNG